MKLFFPISFLAAVGVLSGCASYEDDAQKLRAEWARGNFAAAAAVAGTALEEADGNDRLLWQMERASTLRALGNAEEASSAFEAAAGTLAHWNETPEILLSREALAGLTNLSALPYRGRGSDAVMLHAYRALSFLEAGNSDSARVALNAAYQAQRDAVERNAENIENARKEARENAVDVSAALESSGLDKQLARQEKDLAGVRVLADYVNPFATWLHGVYFLHAGTDGADAERARVSLSRVAAMYPKNEYVAADLQIASRGVPARDEALTYVVFESGLAPILGTVRTDTMLPIPIGNGNVTLMPVSIALPKLVLSDARKYWGVFPLVSGRYSQGSAEPEPVPALSANGAPALEVCDMNSVVRTEFDNAFPSVLVRTIVPAVLKSVASAAANAAALEYARRDGSAGSAIVALATIAASSVYTYASSGADVRCWQTLPQNFSVARVKTPASRRVSVRVGGRSRDVALLPGKVNLVCVKTTSEGGPLVVTQSVLRE